jgi:hypothetical protein
LHDSYFREIRRLTELLLKIKRREAALPGLGAENPKTPVERSHRTSEDSDATASAA